MITLTVNGRDHRLDAEPDTSLLYVCAKILNSTPPNSARGRGRCGAYTVIVDGKAVLFCMTPVLLLEGRKVTTLEGLGTTGDPAPIQRAFIEEQAAQCGRHGDAREGAAAAQCPADRRGNSRRVRTSSVPLRHSHAPPARREPRGRTDAERRRLERTVKTPSTRDAAVQWQFY